LIYDYEDEALKDHDIFVWKEVLDKVRSKYKWYLVLKKERNVPHHLVCVGESKFCLKVELRMRMIVNGEH